MSEEITISNKLGRYKYSEKFLERALNSIPLGSQTFSKSKTQLPLGVSPFFVDHAKGSKIWDIDGNEYIDFVNALACITIGYCDVDIDKAVKQQMENGVTFSLPHRLEAEVAELIIDLIPSAEMVRFGKNGTDATSAAIRLSRAYTGKEHVLVCGYHGWQDWYIGSTSRDLGVPKTVKQLTHSFQYNDLASLETLFNEYQNNVAAVILEPMNLEWPKEHFLENAKELTHKNEAIFIFDETITGCRFANGGAQELFNVIPDLTTLGKGLGNGYPLSVITGKKEIMKKMEDIFFSGTFGGETLSLAAAKVVLNKIMTQPVIKKIHDIGKIVQDGVSELLVKHDINTFMSIHGHPSWSIFSITDIKEYSSWEIKTYFLQEIFKRGIFTIGSHNISYAHTEHDTEVLLNVYDEVFPLVRDTIEKGILSQKLEAEPLQPLFKLR